MNHPDTIPCGPPGIDHEIPIQFAITLEIQRTAGIETRRATSDGLVDGKCPGCGVEPFMVVGQALESPSIHVRRSGAFCVSCGDAVGYVNAPMDDASRRMRGETMFGREEDEAIQLRARVYHGS